MKFWILLFMALLSGCTTTGISESKSPSPDKGVVFASVLFSGSYSENSILIRKVGEADVIRMGLGEAMILVPVFPKSDFADIGYDSMGKKGAVLAEELEPGNYEVFNWRVRGGYRKLVASKSFSIPFTVVKGQATYLGSYHFTHRGYMIDSAKVDADNLLERDTAIFDRKFVGYKGLEKKNAAPPEPLAKLGGHATVSEQIPMPVMTPAPR